MRIGSPIHPARSGSLGGRPRSSSASLTPPKPARIRQLTRVAAYKKAQLPDRIEDNWRVAGGVTFSDQHIP